MKELNMAIRVLQDICKGNCRTYYRDDKSGKESFRKDVYDESETRKKKFREIKIKLENNTLEEDGLEINECFDKNYLHNFLKKCIPFVPLWASVLNCRFINGAKTRMSNATVESWCKTVKIDLLETNFRQKCGLFMYIKCGPRGTAYKKASLKIRKIKVNGANF